MAGVLKHTKFKIEIIHLLEYIQGVHAARENTSGAGWGCQKMQKIILQGGGGLKCTVIELQGVEVIIFQFLTLWQTKFYHKNH